MIRHIIRVYGVVQGVGFRPFVSSLANGLGISGFVRNLGSSVLIDAQGEDGALAEFERRLVDEAPALSAITLVDVSKQPIMRRAGFLVETSQAAEGSVLIPPDVGMCEQCERELFDKNSRRYLYPFTVCTGCGPRFTLIEGVPYDRERTSMKHFEMCPECAREYRDIADRRYRCEPVCCPKCGPSLTLADSAGAVVAADNYEAIRLARQYITQGRIIAVKGIGGFHLACDAHSGEAVDTLRRRKKRDGKPFAVMARSLSAAARYCSINAAEQDMLLSPQKPIVLLQRKAGAGIAQGVAPQNGSLGVMLPYTPLHRLLFDLPDGRCFPDLLVMTSGNLSGEPICIKNSDALKRLSGIADYFVLHNRDILERAEDSVVREFEGRPLFIRRSRGYVPQPVALRTDRPVKGRIFSAGPDLKNTFCLSDGENLYLSGHMGDLDDFGAFGAYKSAIGRFSAFLNIKPDAAACDMHPSYRSSQYAGTLGLDTVYVQHHHAHIASCMADNGLDGEVIGVAFDGTGYGADGTVWGGEFLVCGYRGFKRAGHLRPVKMFGGDSAAAEPWKSAVSHIYDAFGDGAADVARRLGLAGGQEIAVGIAALKANLNCHISSSCGRLFDAVSAICGICSVSTYEGQAAMELEYAADKAYSGAYDFEVYGQEPFVIDTQGIVKSVCRDVLSGRDVSQVSACFHNTLARAVRAACERIRAQRQFKRVCLGGGVFQNMLLLERTVWALRKCGFEVFINRSAPANDGGIALGQAAVAIHKYMP